MQGRLALYLTLIRLEFMKMLAYRVSYVTGIVNYVVQIGAYFFLWQAIFRGQNLVGGYNQGELLTYLIVAWVSRSFYFNNLDRQITTEIKEGSVALELLRPYNYLIVKLARALGEALFRLCFFALPTGLFIYALYPFTLPQTGMDLVAFGTALGFSFILNCLINFLVGLSAFFTLNTSGIQRAKRVMVELFSGLLIPINLYPDWAQSLMQVLPFQAMTYLPTRIYLGKVEGSHFFGTFIFQIAWTLILVLIIWWLWSRAIRNLEIQGG